MKQPKKPKYRQKKLMAKEGYEPDKYNVYFEDKEYLHIIPIGGKAKDVIILNKK